ncbi:MAG TPA: hypothetical protein VN408_27345 [Actinoplanes sp.]|nr:hypothetical protein [Actinoplanes sp.]
MSDLLVVPGWLGPNRMFNPKQGQSYVFGVFTVTPQRLSYAAADGTVVFDVAPSDATIEWPWWLLGGSRVRVPAGTWILTFGRPFPDAPIPDRDSVHRATTALEQIHQRPAADLVHALVPHDPDLSDAKIGRKVGAQVKAALTA